MNLLEAGDIVEREVARLEGLRMVADVLKQAGTLDSLIAERQNALEAAKADADAAQGKVDALKAKAEEVSRKIDADLQAAGLKAGKLVADAAWQASRALEDTKAAADKVRADAQAEADRIEAGARATVDRLTKEAATLAEDIGAAKQALQDFEAQADAAEERLTKAKAAAAALLT